MTEGEGDSVSHRQPGDRTSLPTRSAGDGARAEAGKPVIVSMSSVADRRYFVAMSADKIVAEPATLTVPSACLPARC